MKLFYDMLPSESGGTGKDIPEEVKKAIEKRSEEYVQDEHNKGTFKTSSGEGFSEFVLSNFCDTDFRAGAEYGYSLAAAEISTLEQTIKDESVIDSAPYHPPVTSQSNKELAGKAAVEKRISPMIPANELRVGNRFIRELRNERGLEYDHDFILTEENMGKLFGDNIGLALEDLFPTPLTREMLSELGFEKNDDGDGGYYHELLSGNGILFIEGDKKGYTDVFIDLWEQIRVRHLHQLQNLYFALTGQELSFNPDLISKPTQ